ncbi:MAG: hypothetical protein GC149_00965 [Gammaproteobacteria bacterium]|nr:hypothetical protein [Gammaproteobacteria bacterium]
MTGVHLWWLLISLVGVINIGVWLYAATNFSKRKHLIHPAFYPWRRWVFFLSGIYVFVCAFRSFLPRIDLERVCLVATPLSSMFVGRSLATVAELAFIVQCAILLREAGIGTRVKTATAVFWVLIPLIVVAESFSWYAVLTTNYLGSVVEESLWTVAGCLILISFVALWPRITGVKRYYLLGMILYAIGFVAFMVMVDVPMYWSRWQLELAQNKQYLPLFHGLMDTLRTCHVNFHMSKWWQEIPWMSLYFSITVWVSMAFAYAPSFKSLPANNPD